MSNSPNARKYLTEEELKRLLHVIKVRKSARDEAIFLVTYWRGLRASEVGRIPLSAWNQSKCRLFVTRLKGSLSGEFPLSTAEQSALNAWLKIRGSAPGPLFPSRESGMFGSGIGRKMLHVLMRRYATAALLPIDLRHMHCLKHALGTHLIAKGAGIYEVKDWLGHKDIRSTLVYAQFRNAQRDAAAQKVYEQD
jgi:site-specific recombinase XerD